MLRIQQLKIDVETGEKGLKRAAARALGIREEELLTLQIKRRSLDARKKPQLFYVYTVDVKCREEARVLKRCKTSGVSVAKDSAYRLPAGCKNRPRHRPVVVGMGPAGLFCALALAKAGYCPLILERGEKLAKRRAAVERFFETGKLDVRTNIQFGEGGAGTFSDGKLNTAVKDPTGRNSFVLNTFVEFGAPPEILWLNKPHIGTDLLCGVIENMRKEILRLGGEVRFLSQVTGLRVENGRLRGLIINGEEELPCEIAVLAIGHSARDTFLMLKNCGVPMCQKAFAVGVRIEHPQDMIDRAQYGREAGLLLPAADYKLTGRLEGGRGVYSFCMCPGGYVVNASSEERMLAVNGMSYHARDGENANSAIVVTVTPKDFGDSDVLAGVEFQRRLERAAYDACGGRIPVQLYRDFCENRTSAALGTIKPAVKGSWGFGNVRACFPEGIGQAIARGIADFGRKIRGFDSGDALLFGVESRTSSPVRIERDEHLQSAAAAGLYPCGEGAGYAGGIMSAAMDGLRVAEEILDCAAVDYLDARLNSNKNLS